MTRKVYQSNNVDVSGPYSHAVDAGDYYYFSGQTAYNRKGVSQNLEGDIKTQTEIAFNNLEDVMTEAGVTMDDVVKVNVYLTTMKHFVEMNDVYETKFSAPYPARTCVAVHELPLGAEVEIEVIVKKK